MAEEKKENENIEKAEKIAEEGSVSQTAPVEARKFKPGRGGSQNGRKGRRGPSEREEKKDEFDQRILDIARVTRVMAGGKRMNFRACVAIGDKKGKVAVAMGKGADVTIAVNKAVTRAKKDIVEVPMVNETIPHEVLCELGSSTILFKPARKGRGVIAGGVVRVILELAGVHNVTSKILGASNKINNARCTIAAIKKLKKIDINKKTEKTHEVKDDNKKEGE